MVGLRFSHWLIKLQFGDLLLAVTGVGIRHVRDGPLEHSMDPVALRGVCVASLRVVWGRLVSRSSGYSIEPPHNAQLESDVTADVERCTHMPR